MQKNQADFTKSLKNTSEAVKDTGASTSSLGSAFGNLAGAGFSLSFGLTALNQAVEDGEVSMGEFANVAFLIGPAIGTMVVGLKEATAALVAFSRSATTGAKAQKFGGAGLAAAGLGLAASGVGGTAGQAIGTGLGVGGLLAAIGPTGPVGVGLAATAGIAAGAGVAIDGYLKSQDKVPESIEDLTRQFDKLSKEIDKKPIEVLIRDLENARQLSDDLDFGSRFRSEVTGSLAGGLSVVTDTIINSFKDGDWGSIGNIALDAFGSTFLSGS